MIWYLVLRLTGEEDWDAWGDDWQTHIDVLARVEQVDLPDELKIGGPDRRQLDWGAYLTELSRQELLDAFEPRAMEDYAEIPKDWGIPVPGVIAARDKLREAVAADAADKRYGVAMVEL